MDIHTDPLDSHTGYNIISCFWSEVIAKKNRRKCHLRRLLVEFLENGLSQDPEIVHACWGNWLHKPAAYEAAIAASSPLQNAIKYCTKVRKTGPAGQRVE